MSSRKNRKVKKSLPKRKKTNRNELEIEAHARELIGRAVVIGLVWLGLFITCFVNGKDILSYMLGLATDYGYSLIAIAPQDVFIEEIRVSALIALVVGLPIYLWQVILFISPVFEKVRTRVGVWVAGAAGLVLFACGMVFSFLVIVPFVLQYFRGLGSDVGVMGQVSVSNFVSLIASLELALGLVFEIPMFVAVLSGLGALTPKRMIGLNRYVIVVAFVIGALITPPDVVSQALVAVPIIALYEISILICVVMSRKDRGGNND